MIKRIIKVFSANVIGQMMNIGIQIISVPIFLWFWGAKIYGEWLLLSAIPSYIAVSGAGIGFVSGNSMHRYLAAADEIGAVKTFQSSWLLTNALSMFLLLVTIPAILYLPILESLNVREIRRGDAQLSLILLVVYIIINLQAELLGGAFRASEKFALWTNISNCIRILEFLFCMLIIALGYGVVAVATSYVMVRLAGVVWMYSRIDTNSWIKFGFKYASLSSVKADLIPTISFLGFPFGHACILQGMTTVIGVTLGPTAVVVFSSLRTLTGFIRQFSSAIYYSIWPEFSLALGSGQLEIAKKLHRNAFAITLVFSIFSATALYFLGGWIFKIWTSNKIEFNRILFTFLLLSTIPNVLWMTSSYVSISINKHSTIAVIYAVIATASLFVAYMLTNFIGIVGVPITLVLADIVLLVITLKQSLKLVNDTGKDFWIYLTTYSFREYLKKINSKIIAN